MAPTNPQSAGSTDQISCANGEPEVSKLQRECEQLRRSLAAAEKERDDYRSMFFAYMRATVTVEEKAAMERYVRDLMEDGGVSFREGLNQLKQARGS